MCRYNWFGTLFLCLQCFFEAACFCFCPYAFLLTVCGCSCCKLFHSLKLNAVLLK